MPSSTILTAAFLTAAVANLLFFTGLGGFVLLPLHLRRLGATDGQLGLIMACFSATAIVVQPLVGAWVDRGGRRAFLVCGAILTAAVALAFAAVPDALGWFPLLRALQGAAFSVFFIANFTVVVDLAPPDRRGQALGIFGISGLISGAMGPALGELLAAGGRLSRTLSGLGGPPAPGRRDRGAPQPPAARARWRARGCRDSYAGLFRRPAAADDAWRGLRARAGRDVHVLPDLCGRLGGAMGRRLRGRLLGDGPRPAGDHQRPRGHRRPPGRDHSGDDAPGRRHRAARQPGSDRARHKPSGRTASSRCRASWAAPRMASSTRRSPRSWWM